MAQPTQVEMANYTIYRDSVDQTRLVFYPEKDSDELFDALRAKYPYLKSHSERMGRAVTDFFLQESHLEQRALPQTCAPFLTSMTTTSPMDASFTSFSPHTSVWSSPEMPELMPSTSYTSSPSQPLSRQFSVTTPSEPSPPVLEQMTGVFSLSDAVQPKQRFRRKMTEEERKEYRKRRIVKACDKCSKRKRKCNHNQQEMQTVSSKSHKASRSEVHSTAPRKPTAPDLPPLEDLDEFSLVDQIQFEDSFASDPFQSVDDISHFLEAPMPDMDFEQLLASPQTQWPWSSTADFTLMDSNVDSFATTPVTPQDQQQEFALQQAVFFGDGGTIPGYDIGGVPGDTPLTVAVRNENDAAIRRLLDFDTNENQHSTHAMHAQNRRGEPAFALNNANTRVDWEQRVPQNTIQNDALYQPTEAESIEQQGSRVRANRRIIGDSRRTTHSDAQNRRPENATSHASEQDETEKSRKTSRGLGQDQSTVMIKSDDVNRHQDNSHDIHQTSLERAKNRTSGTFVLDEIIPSGSTEEHRSQQSQQAHPHTSALSPHQNTLGELSGGLTNHTDTKRSTELFMLRRRITNKLSTVMDRDKNATATVASSARTLLQTNPALQISNPLRTSSTTPLQQVPGPLQTNPRREMTTTTSPLQTSVRQQMTCPPLAHSPLLLESTPRHEDTATHTDRLSDHHRCRDHFGRTNLGLAAGFQILTALAAIGSLLTLLSFLPLQIRTPNLSLLLLALASPVRGSKGTHLPPGGAAARSCSQMWGTLVSPTAEDVGVWESEEGMLRYLLKWRKVSSARAWVQEFVGVGMGCWNGVGLSGRTRLEAFAC